MTDAADRALMADTMRAAIADAVATGNVDVDAVLATLGWRELLGEQPDLAVEIVFHALGAANATATALDDVLAAGLGETPRADLAVLLPGFAGWDPPGRIDGEQLEAAGLATRRIAGAAQVLVVCGTDAEPWRVVVPAVAAESEVVRGVDPDAGLRAVRVRGPVTGATRLAPAAWRDAVGLGRRAVAHQMEGASRTMLDLARTHALERVQFGRPIARFQAVRHRLAETLVAVEALAAALLAARDEPGPETAALAKAVAGRTAHTVARHCQQVLAGIGFTTEHRFHRYLKRTMALEGLLGSADAIVLEVGRRLLAERRVPTLIEL
jgi:hypothetical protein